MKGVGIRPSTIYGFTTMGSYEKPISKENLFGYNTSVKVSLPYTLHLPNEMPFEVICPGVGRATVIPRKVWTELAAGSSVVEVIADEHLLYYEPASHRTDHIPQPPESGPWPRMTGTNVEISKDTHGVLRYTLLEVLFDSVIVGVEGPEGDPAVEQAQYAAVEKAQRTAKEIVNYLLDVYRYVTGAEHIERLSSIMTKGVYFAEHNLVSEGFTIESGLRTAIINRSGREIRKIKEMLGSGEEPALHVLLLQSARAALGRGQVVLAIVVSFQALEILLETKLRAGYAKMGVSDLEIARRLKKRYKTAERLKHLCREVTGRSVADDSKFWNSWIVDCNRRRNHVVHKNEAVTDAQAQRVVDLCEDCITRVLALPFPA